MKIAFIIPFKYKFNNYSNVKSHYEYLQILGHDVDLIDLKDKPDIEYDKFDQIWLMGSGAKLQPLIWWALNTNKTPVISFAWSDPNMFDQEHYENCHVYFTNDLNTYRQLKNDKKVHYYQTSSDKRYHKNLHLPKTTDILVYGAGKHKFIPNRNQVVNKLRRKGFNIKVFGRGWDAHKDTRGFIEGKTFIDEINKAHIVLDITNETSAWGHRIFEASACGTPVLTYSREDTKQVLDEYLEFLPYKTFDDLVHHLKRALEKPELLKTIGEYAQKRCYKDHDISVRIKQLFKQLKEIGL